MSNKGDIVDKKGDFGGMKDDIVVQIVRFFIVPYTLYVNDYIFF